MKTIQLTNGHVAMVDDDFERINTFEWYAHWDRSTDAFYAVRNSITINGKRRTICMHREVMAAKTGEQVDHINHDALDNRKENLRVCSSSQNHANQRMRVNNTSGFKGVSWNNARGKWRASLGADGKTRHIGLFTTALEAAIAYDTEARKTFGEFALTNNALGLIQKEIGEL
jgi:HNH endonuclease/AP2 domain